MISDSQYALLQLLAEQLSRRHSVSPSESESSPYPVDEPEILRCLSFIFCDNRKFLESAVEILGDGTTSSSNVNSAASSPGVREYSSASGERKCWRVRGSTQDRDYICLKNYCSCPSFFNSAKSHCGRLMCKHILAIEIAKMLGIVETEKVSDEEFVSLLCPETATNSTASVFTAKPYRTFTHRK